MIAICNNKLCKILRNTLLAGDSNLVDFFIIWEALRILTTYDEWETSDGKIMDNSFQVTESIVDDMYSENSFLKIESIHHSQ